MSNDPKPLSAAELTEIVKLNNEIQNFDGVWYDYQASKIVNALPRLLSMLQPPTVDSPFMVGERDHIPGATKMVPPSDHIEVTRDMVPSDAAVREAVDGLEAAIDVSVRAGAASFGIVINTQVARTLLSHVRAAQSELESERAQRIELQHMQCAHYREDTEVCAANIYWPGVNFWKCDCRAAQAPRLTGERLEALWRACGRLKARGHRMGVQDMLKSFPELAEAFPDLGE